jgi:hypothetical protein
MTANATHAGQRESDEGWNVAETITALLSLAGIPEAHHAQTLRIIASRLDEQRSRHHAT